MQNLPLGLASRTGTSGGKRYWDADQSESLGGHGCACAAPHTGEAFQRLALDGLSGAQPAKSLGMKAATVFVAKSKVQKMLQDEVRNPEHGNESPRPEP